MILIIFNHHASRRVPREHLAATLCPHGEPCATCRSQVQASRSPAPGAKSTSPASRGWGFPQTPRTRILGPRPTREPACACPQRLLLLPGARAAGGRDAGRLPGTRRLAPAHSDHVSSVLGAWLCCSCWCSASASWWLASCTCTSPGPRCVRACCACASPVQGVCACPVAAHARAGVLVASALSGRGGVCPGARPLQLGSVAPQRELTAPCCVPGAWAGAAQGAGDRSTAHEVRGPPRTGVCGDRAAVAAGCGLCLRAASPPPLHF